MDSSEMTNLLKVRAVFTDFTAQSTRFIQGCASRIVTGDGQTCADGTYQTTLVQGNVFVTSTQYSTIVGTADCAYLPPLLPDPPTNLVATPGLTTITISFTPDPKTTVTNYLYSIDGGITFTALSPPDNVSPITISGLAQNTFYNIQLKGVNSIGIGAASATLVTSTLAAASAPYITIVDTGNKSLTVTFIPPTQTGGSPITNYKYSTDGGATYTAFSPAQTTSPLTISSLANGTSYNVSIRAVTAAGDGDVSNSYPQSTYGVPTAPYSLSNTPGLTQLTLSFVQGYDGGLPITNYAYSLGGGAYVPFSPIDISSPVTITGLTNQSTYAVALRAINAAGDGSNSSNISARTADIPPAPIPYSTIAGNSSITILYTLATDGGAPITNYQYSSNAGATFTAFSPNVSSISSATITGLDNLSSYTVALKAVNQFGPSATFSTLTGLTLYTPAKPINLIATPGNSTISISFRQNGDGGSPITNYKYNLNSTTYAFFPGAGYTASPVTLSNLYNQSTYTISLKATNIVGDSLASDTIIAYTAGPPPAPTNLSTISATNTTITASFTQSTDGGSPITNYLYSVDSFATSTLAGTAVSPVTLTSLTSGTLYNIQLKAVNTYGVSPPSVILQANTSGSGPTIPQTPVAAVSNGQAIINFTQQSTGGSPIIRYEYTLNGGTSWATATGTASPIKIPGLSNGTPYTIAIRAVTAAATSAASRSVTVTPSADSVIRVKILGPSYASSYSDPTQLVSTIAPAISTLGYTVQISTSAIRVDGTYTGADLTVPNYNCVVMWTDGNQTYNNSLGTNLNSYVAAGGNLVLGGASFGNVARIPNFTYASYSAFDYSGTQANVSNLNPLTIQDHPTVDNVGALDIGSAFFVPSINITAGATSQATFTSCSPAPGTHFIATRTSPSRVVGMNLYIYTSLGYRSYPKYYTFLTNTIYWAAGTLSI